MAIFFVCGAKRHALFCNILSAFALCIVLCVCTACSGINNSGDEENSVSLGKIAWCNNQKVMVFTDDGAATTPTASPEGANPDTPGPATPIVLKDWSTLKADLGFNVFLPTELPAGSCLLSASGSVHNAIANSSFTLTYLLPDQTSLTITQTPQSDKKTPFECSIMPVISSSSSISVSTIQVNGTPTASTQLCTGTHGTTNITFSVNWNTQKLQQFFQDLQPNANWMPHT